MQDPNAPKELPAADPNLNVGDANNADREGPDDRGEPEELFEEARQDPIIVETADEDSDGEDETTEPWVWGRLCQLWDLSIRVNSISKMTVMNRTRVVVA